MKVMGRGGGKIEEKEEEEEEEEEEDEEEEDRERESSKSSKLSRGKAHAVEWEAFKFQFEDRRAFVKSSERSYSMQIHGRTRVCTASMYDGRDCLLPRGELEEVRN
ncbi:hypothetical protein HZH66_001363 [Vespula vulgaris]|uniref:Uncharacterized protein n=1 Tax=Vespula vulgaris TaxID=7454 RepID=A0A834KUV9_VESVU|nr:hypothetical protein HZH66_001363 [Vespula vulgaris]